jgi:hypothetical protein
VPLSISTHGLFGSVTHLPRHATTRFLAYRVGKPGTSTMIAIKASALNMAAIASRCGKGTVCTERSGQSATGAGHE